MKRFVFLAGVVSLLLGAGCGSPCNDLKKQCDACGEATYKAACQSLVDNGNADVCQLTLDLKTYEKGGVGGCP